MRYTISLSLASLLAGTTAWAEVPRVVTDIPPVHSLVAQVMGDLGTPELLLDRGASEHSFQLRPSQAASLQDAGLIVWVGPELTPWLDSALDSVPETVAQLGLLKAPGVVLQDYAMGHDDAEEAGHDHDHAEAGHDHDHEHAEEAGHDHSHDHAEEAGHEGHDHAHSGTDPHAWLNPANAGAWASAIAAELSRLDPANAATYAANAAAIAATEALDADLAATLAPAADRPFVVFHDAYGYLASRYDLNVAGSVALGDASSPGAQSLRALQETVAAGAAICLFPEVTHDPELLTQMAEGTGAVIGGVLDPVGSAMEPGPGMYAALMRDMAAKIAACTAGT